MLKIVFMGSDAIALPLLNWLGGEGVGVGKVSAVFTQPDRAAGRGQKIQINAIKEWATKGELPVWQPEKFGAEDLDRLKTLRPDLVLVMAYGHILTQEVIDVPRLGTLNLHTSILPAYRGASPIQTAIASGEKETGVSLMRMVRKLDAGPVAGTERVDIGALDTAADIELRLASGCVSLLARCLPPIAEGQQVFVEQDENQVSFCRRLEKNDGVLDFAAPAKQLAARINGLAPWPGCAFELDDQTIKIGLADSLAEEGVAGEVAGSDQEGLLVGTGRGLLRLRRLQRPGGRMLPAGEFLRGCPIAAGSRLQSRPMPALVAREPFPRARPT